MRRVTIAASVTLACVVVALLLIFDGARFGSARGGNGCSAEQEGLGEYLDFPYTIRIAPENRLYIQGYEITGDAVCTWAPGDTMRINGLAVLPSPQSPGVEIPEEKLERVYADVPFIRSLVEAGTTWAQSARRYNQRKQDLRREAGNRYWDVLERTSSDDEATKAVLDSLDRDLLDPSYEPRIRNRVLWWTFAGRPEEFFEMTQRPTPRVSPSRGLPTEAAARAHLTTFARMLESRRKLWVIVVTTSGEALLGGSNAEEALRQIEEATHPGLVSKGPLNEHAVQEILARREGGD